MTRSSVLANATQIEPQAEDRISAARISRAITDTSELSLRLSGGAEIPLPMSLIKILLVSAEELSAGHAITVLPLEVCLSPAEIGRLLGLSRPFIVRLLDSGEIPAQYLPGSRHRVARLADVLAFQAQRESERKGRQTIARIIEDNDLPY